MQLIIQNIRHCRQRVHHFFTKKWLTDKMIVSSGEYDIDHLDGFVAFSEEQIVGLVTYVKRVSEVEIISLDSLLEGRGIGSLLLQGVETTAINHQIPQVLVTTTNDNLQAMIFYQHRGYRFKKVIPDAVDLARRQKPEIPLIGNNHIEIHDELILGKQVISAV